jgi:ATP-binding cassette subfamily B (MDR/TAP) protein 1
MNSSNAQVSFAYPARPDCLVLDNVSLFLPSRDLTYIVGTSGSGKSTLGALLTKLYDPSTGTITLGGQSIAGLPASWIRQKVHYLPQMSVLFEETVGRNIALGKGNDWENVSRDEILTAAQKAMLQAVLFEDLPNGIDTVVGDGGVSVSGGQRQRIALARAILRDSEVLILDEATSALDYISRSLVNDAIRLVRQGKTTIIITHDVSMINEMDFAYVLQSGQVVQSGFKRDLMTNLSGQFYQMAKALDRPQSSVEPILPAYSPPSANINGVRVRQSDGLWMSNRHSVFGSHVSLAPRPLTMSDGDLMMSNTDIEEVWRVAVAGRATATKRQQKGRLARAPAVPSISESVVSGDTDSTYIEKPSSKTKRNATARAAKKETDNLSEKDIEAALEGKQIGALSIWQMLKTAPKCLTPWQNLLMLIGFVATITNGAATPAFGYTLSQLMSNLFNPNSSSRISLYWALAVLGVAAIDGMTTYLKTYLLESSAEKWVYRTRKEGIKRIFKQDCEWFLRNEGQPSIIATRLINSGEEMRHILGRFAGNILNAVTMLGLGVIWALVVGWELTLIGLALTPIIFFSTKAYVAICEKFEQSVVRQVEKSTMVLHEVTRNIKAVVGLGLEHYFEQKFLKEVTCARSVATRKVFWIGAAFGVLEGVGYFSKGMLSRDVINHSIDFLVRSTFGVRGKVFCASDAYYLHFDHLLDDHRRSDNEIRYYDLYALLMLVPQLSKSKESANHVIALAALSKQTEESIGDGKFPIKGEIALENVTFSYPSRMNHTVLRNLTLEIKAGETIAIVGASGSGKSTITNLIQRFYNPTNPHRGKITLDGADIKAIDVTFLRSKMAVVSQTPYLFDLTIRENITYGLNPGRFDISDVEIEKAARLAGIHDFITSLIQGYDTPLGDCGSTLSGGQAQRIALARALVRNPQILILDECTSGLDPESSRAVQGAVSGLVKEGERTTIIVTHKEEMIKIADRVVVMKNGEIVEVGTFDEVCALKGELWNILRSGEWEG